MIERIFRPMWAFVFRDFHLNRRYLNWVLVFTFYAVVNSATIALIGVATNDPKLLLNLVLGVVLWSYLAAMFSEIAQSISWERWEGTLEYTFMAPVSRLVHLTGVSISATGYALVRVVLVVLGLLVIVPFSLHGANLLGVLCVMVVGSLAFMGLGLMAAVLPVMSPENGGPATNIFQGLMLLVSGIYYPVTVLPKWLQPFSYLSPATYALRACRKLMGIDVALSPSGRLMGAGLRDVLPELGILLLMGAVLIPMGLLVFNRAEHWAKQTGKLKRTG